MPWITSKSKTPRPPINDSSDDTLAKAPISFFSKDENLREWADEEAGDDIVYKIYLRRLLHQPTKVNKNQLNNSNANGINGLPGRLGSPGSAAQYSNNTLTSQMSSGSNGMSNSTLNASSSSHHNNHNHNNDDHNHPQSGKAKGSENLRLPSEHHHSNYTNAAQDGKLWETQKIRIVKQASLDQLIDHLAVCILNTDDVNFFQVFVHTFRVFSSPNDIVSMLIERYKLLSSPEYAMALSGNRIGGGNKGAGLSLADSTSMLNLSNVSSKLRPSEQLQDVKRSIIRVFELWITDHGLQDFDDGTEVMSPVMTKLIEFTLEYMGEDSDLYHKIKNVLKAVQNKRRQKAQEQREFDEFARQAALDDPALAGNREKPTQSKIFLQFTAQDAATQFIRMDAKLFCDLVPSQCLGGIWSRRQQLQSKHINTVKATIDQFNKVVYAVTSTVLCPSLTMDDRSKCITKWIEIAQELSRKKNLSTLKAILSALQSHSVHRLEKTWSDVPKHHESSLKDLNVIFDDVQSTVKQLQKQTNLLNKDDINNTEFFWLTRKFDLHNPEFIKMWKQTQLSLERQNKQKLQATNSSNNQPKDTSRWLTKKSSRHNFENNSNEAAGSNGNNENPHVIIPYLGGFLTDLMTLDTASSDMTEEGLVNFEKRRKEFEVIALLKLLQLTCSELKTLPTDKIFNRWLHNVQQLQEQEMYDLSIAIEPLDSDSSRSNTLPHTTSNEENRQCKRNNSSNFKRTISGLIPFNQQNQNQNAQQNNNNTALNPQARSAERSHESAISDDSGVRVSDNASFSAFQSNSNSSRNSNNLNDSRNPEMLFNSLTNAMGRPSSEDEDAVGLTMGQNGNGTLGKSGKPPLGNPTGAKGAELNNSTKHSKESNRSTEGNFAKNKLHALEEDKQQLTKSFSNESIESSRYHTINIQFAMEKCEIRVLQNDRTKKVLQRAFTTLGVIDPLNDEVSVVGTKGRVKLELNERYKLIQQMADGKKLAMPDDTNVYYALRIDGESWAQHLRKCDVANTRILGPLVCSLPKPLPPQTLLIPSKTEAPA